MKNNKITDNCKKVALKIADEIAERINMIPFEEINDDGKFSYPRQYILEKLIYKLQMMI